MAPAGAASGGIIVALLDTSVLFPFHLRNTLLYAAELELYRPRWSPDILDELARALLADGGRSEAQVQHLLREMRAAFGGAEVVGYQQFVARMTNHPKDRHVLAAAVHARAQVVVTSNLRHFPRSALAPLGVDARSPDQFLLDRLAASPQRMAEALAAQVEAYRAPPMTLDEVLERLAVQVPRFVARLQRG